MTRDANGFNDDTTDPVSIGAAQQAEPAAKPFDEGGMYREPESLASALRVCGNYVSQETLHEACDWLLVALTGAPNLALSFRQQIEKFIKRHGRTIQQIQDDSRG